MQNTLIIFIKNPELGKVKTRLAKSIGETEALRVYNDLLEKTKRETLKVKAKRILYFSESSDGSDFWSQNKFEKYIQKGNSLGQRMANAFEACHQIKTVIIGSDCYDLTTNTIEKAFKMLDENDLVVGPANDGGYYLLGVKKYNPKLFQDIDWSTEKVLRQTLTIADQLGWSVSLLEELVDLDTFSDLEKSTYKYKPQL